MARRFTEYQPLHEIARAPRNPKGHDMGGIGASMKRHGFVETPTLDERTGRLVAGHGRLDQLVALQRAGAQPPEGIELAEDGTWLVPVSRGWASANDPEAEAYVVTSNRLVESGGWDTAGLVEMLDDLTRTPLGLDGTGYTPVDLGTMHADLERATMNREEAHETKGDKRLRDVDLIYTAAALSSIDGPTAAVVLGHCCLAVRSGWSYGVRSGERDRACRACDTWRLHRPMFVDNDYEHYDHARHRAIVAHWTPKYATVRDVMTPEQCEAAGIDFYPLEQILEWAEDLLETGAENIIVIPKVDVLDKIPEKYVIGYSVPSSYGGTPLPTEAFKGRRVHLLGGSPNAQLSYWKRLPDEVVSIDNNSLLRVAQWGTVWKKDATSGTLSDFGIEAGDTTNPMYVALALSFGFVGAWFLRDQSAQDDNVVEEATIRE